MLCLFLLRRSNAVLAKQLVIIHAVLAKLPLLVSYYFRQIVCIDEVAISPQYCGSGYVSNNYEQ